MFVETNPLNVATGACGNGVNVGLDLGVVRFFVGLAVFPVLEKIGCAGHYHPNRRDGNDGMDGMDFMICCFHLCIVYKLPLL
jgi:hypothetical protein